MERSFVQYQALVSREGKQHQQKFPVLSQVHDAMYRHTSFASTATCAFVPLPFCRLHAGLETSVPATRRVAGVSMRSSHPDGYHRVLITR
jgi:hypothetical protein